MQGALKNLTIRGFKSIQELNEFHLGNLNVIIGANGSGKSNLILTFRMLMEMTKKHFTQFIKKRGGADNFLFNGPQITDKIYMEFEFDSGSYKSKGSNFYRFELIPTMDNTFLINEEKKYLEETNWQSYGTPSQESRLADNSNESGQIYSDFQGVGYYVYNSISKWIVYHFHDTSPSSPMRRLGEWQDFHKLRGNAANIAPFLLNLKNNYPGSYEKIVETVRLVIPFFDNFRLDVQRLGEAEQVRLGWQQKGSDFPMQPYHLSDGSIRFICLATALLQPEPPSMIIIDEPELGLHPEAIVVLAELIQVASRQTQVVIATQSPALIDQFSIKDIIVAKRKNGASTFERLQEEQFSQWLENYSTGELWTKNVISGGPVYE
jgi:predicted ATPase